MHLDLDVNYLYLDLIFLQILNILSLMDNLLLFD